MKKENDWCFGYLNYDNYHGWIKFVHVKKALKPNFLVTAPSTIILNKPNIKSLVIDYLSIGSLVNVINFKDAWAEVNFYYNQKSTIGYIPKIHLKSVDKPCLDWINVAESMVGVPYKWGGKTNRGIDCSGLLQISLKLSGKFAPRNSKDQIKELGYDLFTKKELECKNFNELWNSKIKRGDLVFWKGHVGIVNQPSTILHANIDTNNVSIVSWNSLLKNYNKKGLKLIAVKRLS